MAGWGLSVRCGRSGGATVANERPRYHFSFPARNEHEVEEVSWPAIPDRSPGHAFVPIAHAGRGPAHEGMKIGAPVGGSSLRLLGTRVGCRSAWSGGQAPALHSSFPARNEHELEDVSSPAIPDRSPGHAFVPMTKSGTRRTRRVPGVQGG